MKSEITTNKIGYGFAWQKTDQHHDRATKKKVKRILPIEDLFVRLYCFDSPYFTLLFDVHFYPYLTMGGREQKKADRKNWKQMKMILKQNKANTFENKTVKLAKNILKHKTISANKTRYCAFANGKEQLNRMQYQFMFCIESSLILHSKQGLKLPEALPDSRSSKNRDKMTKRSIKISKQSINLLKLPINS